MSSTEHTQQRINKLRQRQEKLSKKEHRLQRRLINAELEKGALDSLVHYLETQLSHPHFHHPVSFRLPINTRWIGQRLASYFMSAKQDTLRLYVIRLLAPHIDKEALETAKVKVLRYPGHPELYVEVTLLRSP